MRRLLLLVGAIVLVDMMFYAAITPLLPVYVDRYGLSKTGAGLLAGSYAAGGLLGTFPAGWLATRAGSRRAVLVGLALMSLASLGFAFGRTIVVLDAMRFVQGLGGACTWAGGLGWLVAGTPPERRGQTIGSVLSVAVGGLLLGPLLGTLARAIGPELPFGGIALLGVLLFALALRIDAPAPARVDQPLLGALRDSRVVAGMALVGMAALVFGAIGVLVPLRLDRLGASGAAIGATFLVAAGFEAIGQSLVGRAVDRHGRERPIRLCLVGTIAFLVVVPVPQVAWLFSAVVIVGCVVCGVLNTPAMTLISDGVERAGLDQGLGFALVNLTWASGQVGGAIAGATLARATSDAVAYLTLAGVCTATLAWVLRGSRTLAPVGDPA